MRTCPEKACVLGASAMFIAAVDVVEGLGTVPSQAIQNVTAIIGHKSAQVVEFKNLYFYEF